MISVIINKWKKYQYSIVQIIKKIYIDEKKQKCLYDKYMINLYFMINIISNILYDKYTIFICIYLLRYLSLFIYLYL